MTKLYLIIVAIIITTLVTIGITEEVNAQASTTVCSYVPWLFPSGYAGHKEVCCIQTWNNYTGFYQGHSCWSTGRWY